MYKCRHVKQPLFLSDFMFLFVFVFISYCFICPVLALSFRWIFRKTLKYQISWKSAQWKSDGRTDRQTDMTKLIVTFVFVRMCLKEQSINKGFPVSTQHSTRSILRAQQLSSPIRKVLTYFEWWPCCLTLYGTFELEMFHPEVFVK